MKGLKRTTQFRTIGTERGRGLVLTPSDDGVEDALLVAHLQIVALEKLAKLRPSKGSKEGGQCD